TYDPRFGRNSGDGICLSGLSGEPPEDFYGPPDFPEGHRSIFAAVRTLRKHAFVLLRPSEVSGRSPERKFAPPESPEGHICANSSRRTFRKGAVALIWVAELSGRAHF